MNRTNPASVITVVAVIAGGGVVAVDSAVAASSPTAAAVFNSIARQAPAALGSGGFVCRVGQRDGSRPIRRVQLFVADRHAKAKALRLSRRLGAGGVLTVTIGQQRRRHRDLTTLASRMRADAPQRAISRGDLKIAIRPAIGTSCPKIGVTLSNDANERSTLEWVNAIEKRYGADRVELVTPGGSSST